MHTMRKPTPRREVAIELVDVNTIVFWATEEAAADFAEFGVLSRDADSNRYRLYVDVRYGMKEVIDYIDAYDKQHRNLPPWS